VSATAAKLLKKLKVKVLMGVKVEGTTFDPAKKEWTVNLSNGSKLEADLYISAKGVIPNKLLSRDGLVKVDENLAVVGASSVYAVGTSPTAIKSLMPLQSRMPKPLLRISKVR